MSLNKFFRYWHTLRYLRPVQFYGRVWFRFYKPKPSTKTAPPLRRLGTGWQVPAAREPSLLGPEQFFFLNEEGDLRSLGWDGEQRSKLWRYNQHYFDDLNAEQAESRAEWHSALVRRWVTDNPPGQGTGWEPYPTSLRIVNWVKWAMAGHALPDECVQSLAVQTRWLAQRLEIHLLGNHLFANAKALVFAGSFFSGPEAERWLKTGLRILEREVPEQILPDGGHFERSTMYHALALEDMLDLLNVLRCLESTDGPLSDNLQRSVSQFLAISPECISSMVRWLNAMRHPDGELSFFNDAALGVAPSCESLLGYAQRMGFDAQPLFAESTYQSESGYVRLVGPDACLLFDAAPVGPDYLPGHAHADTLSVELSLFGQRVLVNSGTSEYGVSDERLRQRGTAAHSTVEVAGEDSSEVWCGFRVARRAYPFGVEVKKHDGVQQAIGWHDGYCRLPSPVDVGRTVRLAKDTLEIEDSLRGDYEYAVARFYCHPSVRAETAGDSIVKLELAGGQHARMQFDGGDLVSVEDSTWHPRFGVVERNRCVVAVIKTKRLLTRLEWRES